MNILSTNTITNVYNVGTGSCDAGTKYCTNEYALYFPCLKDVTRGQNVCFDFYIADGSTQDVVDLRTVDAISLNLNGQFNCSYGSFSYPDNIFSLQKEEYPEIYSLDFNDGNQCLLSVVMIDKDTKDILNTIGDECDSEPLYFWSGTKIFLKAEDTPTHIFIGWTVVDSSEDDCPEDDLEDYIISTSKEYSFIIKEHTIITALYRERRKFNIISDENNRNLLFEITYYDPYQTIGGEDGYLSNRRNDGYDEIESGKGLGTAYDKIENVLEGYEFVATCIPSDLTIDSEDVPDDDITYVFRQWKDGRKDQCRKFIIGGVGCDGTAYYEEGNEIRLRAICDGPVPGHVEEPSTDKSPNNNFDEEGIHILNNTDDSYSYDYYGDDKYIKSAENVKKCADDGEYLHLGDSGKLILSSKGIENGIKIDIHAQAASDSSDSEPCKLTISINDYAIDHEIDDFKNYEFYFTKCNSSDIEISVDGDCIIDKIIIYKEVLIDGGKAQFCLDAETTSKIPPGPLFVNGAIAVGELSIDENGDIVVENPQAYGLASTSIGQVNKLPKININIK